MPDHFWVQNIKLGKIWPSRFNGLKKMKLKPQYGVSSSKNKDLVTQSVFQNVWKILLCNKLLMVRCNLVNSLGRIDVFLTISFLNNPNLTRVSLRKKNLNSCQESNNKDVLLKVRKSQKEFELSLTHPKTNENFLP